MASQSLLKAHPSLEHSILGGQELVLGAKIFVCEMKSEPEVLELTGAKSYIKFKPTNLCSRSISFQKIHQQKSAPSLKVNSCAE